MSRSAFLLGVGLTLVAMAFAATHVLLGSRPGVTEERFRHIRRGSSFGFFRFLGSSFFRSRPGLIRRRPCSRGTAGIRRSRSILATLSRDLGGLAGRIRLFILIGRGRQHVSRSGHRFVNVGVLILRHRGRDFRWGS